MDGAEKLVSDTFPQATMFSLDRAPFFGTFRFSAAARVSTLDVRFLSP